MLSLLSGNTNQQLKKGGREGERKQKRGKDRERQGQTEGRVVSFRLLEQEILLFISGVFEHIVFSDY